MKSGMTSIHYLVHESLLPHPDTLILTLIPPLSPTPHLTPTPHVSGESDQRDEEHAQTIETLQATYRQVIDPPPRHLSSAQPHHNHQLPSRSTSL